VLGDGVLLSNFEADISGKPDITFVSHETSGAEKVRQIEGKKGGVTELQGSPDLVVEVISNSSVQKDTVKLREAYWKAGIREYWLADARSEKVRFSIFRYTKKGYVEAKPSADGWLKSSVVGRSFRISQKPDVGGAPKFKLEID